MSDQIRLLRGQCVIREDLRADYRKYSSIFVPDVWTTDDKDAVARARTWHQGVVLALGAPVLTAGGAEVPPGYAVGDTVVFHWEHHEKAYTRPWVDGENACWIPQGCVDGVVET